MTKKLTVASLLSVFLAVIAYITLSPDLDTISAPDQPLVEDQDVVQSQRTRQVDLLHSEDQPQEHRDIPAEIKESDAAIVNRQLLPFLFASNDLDALIAGAVLANFEPEEGIDATHRSEEFLSLALSINQDDPLLLSVVTLYCGRYAGPYGEAARSYAQSLGEVPINNSLCDSTPYLDMLSDSAGDNAWIWVQRAWRDEADPELVLQHLQHLETAAYYNSYEMEMATLMSGVMQQYGSDVDVEYLTRHGLVRSMNMGYQYPMGYLCRGLETQRERIQPCQTMKGYLLDGLSFRSQIEGSTIGMHLKWQEGGQTDRAQFIQAFDYNAYLRFEDMLRRYPDVKQAYFKNQERYFDIDAINLTMFQFGVIDEMVGEPRELHPNQGHAGYSD